MKKFIVSLFMAVMALPVMAQSVLELPEFDSGKAVWFVRAGASLSGVTGSGINDQKDVWNKNRYDGSFKRTLGASFSVGFNKSFGNSPIYWGMELGAGMRGYKTESNKNGSSSVKSAGNWSIVSTTSDNAKLTAFNAQLMPMIGYKFLLNDRIALDIHVGGFASYDFAGEIKNDYSSSYYTTSDHGGSSQSRNESGSTKIGDIDKYQNHDFGVVAGAGVWFGHFNLDFLWQRGFISIYDIDNGYFNNKLQLRIGYAF